MRICRTKGGAYGCPVQCMAGERRDRGNELVALEFLKAVATTRSLKAAADQMSCSYHEAQLKLDEMENGLGYKLVTYIPCDEGKDEIELTAEGEKLLQDFEEDVRNKMREKFQ